MKKSDSACRAIRAARTESQVVAALRSYLSSLDAAEVVLIPVQILTLGLNHAEESVQQALELIHTQMASVREAPQSSMLNEIALVFSTAARRLAVLAKDVT